MSGAVHVLPLPTPFAVGAVNAYLVDDDPLTLVDTGPDHGTTLVALTSALAEHGRRIEDLERIVLTHQHVDHVGLAGILAERSAAEVCALSELADWLAEYDERMADEAGFIERLMICHGAPSALARGLRAVSPGREAWAAGVAVTRRLRDGDELPFAGRAWRVHHRPGHSPSDTVFHDESTGELFGGDHLIEHISSNAVVSPPLCRDEAEEIHRPRSLRNYLESLRETRAADVRIVRPGHGQAITEHRALIADRLVGHERRMVQIAAILDSGPTTAFQIAEAIWGDAAVTQPYLTLSEVLGHVDLLIERGGATMLDEAEPVRYAAVG